MSIALPEQVFTLLMPSILQTSEQPAFGLQVVIVMQNNL